MISKHHSTLHLRLSAARNPSRCPESLPLGGETLKTEIGLEPGPWISMRSPQLDALGDPVPRSAPPCPQLPFIQHEGRGGREEALPVLELMHVRQVLHAYYRPRALLLHRSGVWSSNTRRGVRGHPALQWPSWGLNLPLCLAWSWSVRNTKLLGWGQGGGGYWWTARGARGAPWGLPRQDRRREGRESSGLVSGSAAEGAAHPAGALSCEPMDSVNI